MAKTAQDLIAEAKAHINEITSQQLEHLIEQGAVLLDVREPEEFEAGHISLAHHIPRGLLEFKIEQHQVLNNKEQAIIVYCQSGGRSALATAALQIMGYSDVYSLSGGYQNWKACKN